MQRDFYECSGVIQHGRLVVSGKKIFEEAMRCFADGVVTVTIAAPKRQRSHQQNKFYHAVVVPLFSEHCGYPLDEMKDVLSLKLIPREIVDPATGEIYVVPGHTSRLSVAEFNQLIEDAQRWGAELGIYVPSPNEVPVP